MKNNFTVVVLSVALFTGICGTAYAMNTSPAGEPLENEASIIGNAHTKASAAALLHTGGGKVTETEVGDEESFYEVEVTLENGNQVDVQLDENFKVVDQKAEGSGDDNKADDR